jgi:pilus assembly protein CpaF
MASLTYLETLSTQIRDEVLQNGRLIKASDDELRTEIQNLVVSRLEGSTISDKAAVANEVFSSIRGFGLLDKIIADDTITEVMINGHETIFVEKAGRVTQIEEKFESERALLDVIQRIVAIAGREVNQANPIVDTRLPDGSRVNVVLPPISLVGPIVTIRKFSKTPMTIDKLISYKSITPEIAEVLRVLVVCKYNIFISGGTGSGKTTFLNALSNYIPHDERVITIEDSAELQIENVDNLVSCETRNANSTGTGEVSMRDLIKSSLRMRPERIVVGECRGGEALDMLQAMNTGHDGSLSTGHANSTVDMLSRLETMVLQGSAGLPIEAIRQQIGSAIDIIIHLSRLRDHSRKTMAISEVVGYIDGKLVVNTLYEFQEDENSTLEKVSGGLVRTKNPLKDTFKMILSGYSTDIINEGLTDPNAIPINVNNETDGGENA